MKTSYKFKRNGFELTMHLNIPMQEISSVNTINVSFDIIGLSFGDGIIEFNEGHLISHKHLEFKPYINSRKILYGYCVKIPKKTIKQIKSYLS